METIHDRLQVVNDIGGQSIDIRQVKTVLLRDYTVKYFAGGILLSLLPNSCLVSPGLSFLFI